MGDDFFSLLIGFILWIVVGALLMLVLALLSSLVWASVITFMAMLYWFFFRALRIVFKHAKSCKGNFLRSVAYGLMHTAGYVAWMHGVFAAIHAWHH